MHESNMAINPKWRFRKCELLISSAVESWKLWHPTGDGEGGTDADATVATIWDLRKRLSEFARKDWFNADECGLNYCMPPDKTVAHEMLLGRKKVEERIAVLLCYNTNGTETYEPMFIRMSPKSSPFE